MTDAEKKVSCLEAKLVGVESRAQSNTKRLNSLDEEVHDLRKLVSSIEKLAVEVKFMRNDLNETTERLDKLEGQDNNKWEKFKWAILTVVISVLVAYLAKVIGIK